jgi:hypothetical protein
MNLIFNIERNETISGAGATNSFKDPQILVSFIILADIEPKQRQPCFDGSSSDSSSSDGSSFYPNDLYRKILNNYAFSELYKFIFTFFVFVYGNILCTVCRNLL